MDREGLWWSNAPTRHWLFKRDLPVPSTTTANIPPLTTAPSGSPPRASASASAPPARWSLTNRVFHLNYSLRSNRPPASRLWNPVNSSPRTLAVHHHHHHQDDQDDQDDRGESPLLLTLSLPQQCQSRAPSSLAVQRSTDGDSISRRTAAMSTDPADTHPHHHHHHHHGPDVETGPSNPQPPTRASLPASPRTSMHSAHHHADDQSDFPWGPSHPCFPHPNPHVPLHSELSANTRIIRIKRDWMMAGDLAPTFANLYPEILDPLVNEDEFRILIKKINDTLVEAFDPFTFRAWLDAVMGVATFWLWDHVGLTAVKRKLARLERWIEDWNRSVGDKEAVKIIALRRTAYLTLDIQIPDPHLAPDNDSTPTATMDHPYLAYPTTPTLQLNSQPQPTLL